MQALNVSLPLFAAKPVVGEARARVAQRLDAAFDFVARDFFRNYQRWQPQVVELEPNGDVAAEVGVKARQVTLERGIRSESTFEIVAIERRRRFEIAGLSEPFQSSYAFDEAGDETALTFKFELREVELSMRPFVKLIRSALQDGAEQTVENLKSLLEGEAGLRPSPPQSA